MAFKGGKGGVTYRVKNVKSVFNAVEAIYRDLTQQKEELDKIGKFARDRIVAETRKGNDLTQEKKQPELSEGYIGYRRRLKSRGKKFEKELAKSGNVESAFKAGNIRADTPTPDSTFFVPQKSNLTLTGQLLNSIDYEVVQEDKKIVIKPTGSRDDGKTNLEVATELATRKTRLAPQGRKFLGLDKRGFQRIRNLIVESIRRIAHKKGF